MEINNQTTIKQLINISKIIIITVTVIAGVIFSCTPLPPAPVSPVPTEHQIAWQEMEFYGFIHFSINTFTNQEWGYGDKSPELFNPTELDARQWARVAKEAGMKGLILTDKHHDGFCLWQSKYTEYSVKNSPWKNGKGDVVKELADACREYGLKMGVYLSPWDRNSADYGKPEYITYLRNQLTELLTNYGDIFEVWFDGANGGDGYYGGAKETRRVDKRTYYDWGNTIKIIRELQPNAIVWSDAGPDARWVGNEHGFAYRTTWSPLLRNEVYGGMPEYAKKYSMGQENGTHWVPAEADVSIRPGWYYHKSEDNKVKSLKHLLDIYYKSVGQNATLLLNLPVDRRGLVNENDERQLKKMVAQLKEDFDTDLITKKVGEASNVRGGANKYGVANLTDGNKESYWATDDEIITASITIDLGQPTEFNRFLIQEYIRLGQRVNKFSLEAEVNGKWVTIDNQTTIGYKRILRFDNVTATKIRVNIEDSKACPVISNIQVFNAPVIVDTPTISRSKEGQINIINPEKGVEVYYTTDGSTPSKSSTKYSGTFEVDAPMIIQAFSYDSKTKRQSDVVEIYFDVNKKKWSVISNDKKASAVIDENPNSEWVVENKKGKPEVVINFGEKETLTGFTYTPTQRRWKSGIIIHYSFYISDNGKNWFLASKGEFSNILNNPIEQEIALGKTIKTKYIKLVADKIMNNSKKAVIAEIGVVTRK